MSKRRSGITLKIKLNGERTARLYEALHYVLGRMPYDHEVNKAVGNMIDTTSYQLLLDKSRTEAAKKVEAPNETETTDTALVSKSE